MPLSTERLTSRLDHAQDRAKKGRVDAYHRYTLHL